MDQKAPGSCAHELETILLVEDDELLRKLEATCLRRGGFRVWEAGSCEEALEILERVGTFSLVVTDLMLPGLCGTDLLATLRRRQPEARAMAVSGGATNVEQEWLRRHGIPLLCKPIGGKELLARVRGLLELTPAPRDTPLQATVITG